MTPGAGTAQSVGRVWRRWMRASSVGLQFCCGGFVVLRWSSGRHKWRPYVWGWLNVVLRWPVRGVARRGAIHDARCRNGTIGQPRWVLADVACCGRFAALRRSSGCHKWRPYVWGRSNVVWRRPVRGVARRGAIHDARCRNGTIGQPRLASADVACCGRFVVLYWPVRGIAVAVRASQVAPPRLRAVECRFVSVGSRFCVGRPGVTSGAPTFAAIDCCFASAGSRHCGGHPGVTSGAPTFAGG